MRFEFLTIKKVLLSEVARIRETLANWKEKMSAKQEELDQTE